jgi:hypothetical protein
MEGSVLILDNLHSDAIGLLFMLIWLGVVGYLVSTLPRDGGSMDKPGDKESP